MSRNRQQFYQLFVVLAATLTFSTGEHARFDNYPIYKLNADTEVEVAFLRNLESSSDSLIFLDDIHFVGKDVHVTVAPHKVPDFLQALSMNDIAYQLVESNFQSVLDKTDRQAEASTRKASDYNWEEYQQLDVTYVWMRSLALKYPGVVTLIEGGKSYERRSILGVKISLKNGKKHKPGIFVESGMHAREWISPATATYIINQLLTSDDVEIQQIALNYDWYIFPHVNPDGYVYTHTNVRTWRKTRSPQANGCFGTDPNRNWDFHWNEIGASSNPCVETFAGPSPFSDIETFSLSQYIASLKGKINLYISFHSFSQLILYPYGAIGDLPQNNKDLTQVFNATVTAISKRYGTKYIGGNTYTAIYPAAGSSMDWVYAKAGIKMAFCLELRPQKGSILYGFRLPAKQIIPTGEETLDGVIAMIKEADKLGYFRRAP